ncbi:Ketosteroid isomerase-related protein [Enhygromyxa salina]|uniref:Ketosteroid isomerase-related protein n=1 Tax=Enhygromyxa salina TaxID=215803 RepID=A0A0C2A7N9_9BACT|nr:nuclear transport factor 2 family protein [Enhygromyxa salina]KIG19618.1 Ketosteroid isomerase-related protein [Enhygromyxa salina]
MPTPTEVIEQFYTAFAKQDAEGMVACYHPKVTFSDPVFVGLDAREACGMWRMLCERAQDFSLEFSNVKAEGDRGSAHWEAHYTFSTTGRHVHNVIDAEFRFADGKIIEHRDQFDFHRWSRQALGMPGLLLGWTSVIRNKVRGQARKGLENYLQKHSG